MSDASKRLRNAFLAAAGLLFVGGFLLSRFAPEQAQIEPAGAEVALRPVDLHRVEAAELRARGEVSGVLEGRREATLFSETRGPVLELGVEELDRVEAGQRLLRIDPLQAEVAVERARHRLVVADAAHPAVAGPGLARGAGGGGASRPMQHRLYFLPLPHGQGSFRCAVMRSRTRR